MKTEKLTVESVAKSLAQHFQRTYVKTEDIKAEKIIQDLLKQIQTELQLECCYDNRIIFRVFNNYLNEK